MARAKRSNAETKVDPLELDFLLFRHGLKSQDEIESRHGLQPGELIELLNAAIGTLSVSGVYGVARRPTRAYMIGHVELPLGGSYMRAVDPNSEIVNRAIDQVSPCESDVRVCREAIVCGIRDYPPEFDGKDVYVT